MELRHVGLALAAGLATFLVVGVVVTELALPFIAFSLFVGIPVGLVAGLTVTVFVLLGLADELPTRRRRAAIAVGSFGVVFLLVFVVEAVILSTRNSVALPVAAIVGVLAAGLAYWQSGG
jgi:hypothetical protein